MSPDFRSALINAIPTPTNARTIRLLNEPGEADERFDGPPLWRRFEAGEDISFVSRAAHDIAAWVQAA